MSAPFTGHLYRIEGDAARMAIISNFYVLQAMSKIAPDARILDFGGGYVLCTLAPDAFTVTGAPVSTEAVAA
jgi:hypothetical protein